MAQATLYVLYINGLPRDQNPRALAKDVDLNSFYNSEL